MSKIKIKAVAIDIDGTLTDNKRRLHLGAVARLREIEALGVPVILATGNVLCLTEYSSVLLGTSGCLIAENGGIIKNVHNNEGIYLADIEKVREAFEYLSKKLQVRKVSKSELRKTEIAIYRDFSVEKIRDILKDFKDIEVVDTKFAIHIKNKKVNKGLALKKIAEIMGISLEEIVAIGDSENDKEMLEMAGYAISVGEESLRRFCNVVTKKRFGEGGKEALEHVIEKIKGDKILNNQK